MRTPLLLYALALVVRAALIALFPTPPTRTPSITEFPLVAIPIVAWLGTRIRRLDPADVSAHVALESRRRGNAEAHEDAEVLFHVALVPEPEHHLVRHDRRRPTSARGPR